MQNRFATLWIAAMLASGILLWQSSRNNQADEKQGQAGQKSGQAEAAPEGADASTKETKVEELVGGLAFPTALALRAGAPRGEFEVWIAESGSQRVIRFQSQTPDAIAEAVVGLGGTAEADDESPTERPAPHGLLFLSRNRLLLTLAGEASLRDLEVSDDALPADATAAKQVSFADKTPAGALGSLVRHPDGYFIVGAGADNANTVYRSIVQGAQLGPIEKFRDVSLEEGGTNPRAMVLSSKGYLVVGLAGADGGGEGESRLVFLDPYRPDAAPVMVLKTGLADIAALAYHPKSGSLYAANSSWSDAEQGGIYRLDAKPVDEGGNESCEAVLVAKLPYATALEFDSEGNLYALSAGAATQGGEPQGKLVKLTGQM